jgi:ribosomal protein S18 acetylase RimI-like enzyme
MTIRDLQPAELGFLDDMLFAALDWRPEGELPPKEFVLEHPQVVIYRRGWGRRGDVALVAEEDGRPVGTVWCRLFTDDEHGEGYYDAETPELAIAVVDGARGRGIGRALMDAMQAHLRANGFRRVSLSVDLDNPAKRLYERLGYAEVSPGDPGGLMLLELG